MGEATERPGQLPASGGSAPVRSSAPAPASAATGIAIPPAPESDGAGDVAYRPISLLAIIGFSIAALFAAVVVTFGLVAILRGVPFLLDLTILVVPLGAAAICTAAWVKIQRSEGALAGAKLAAWGILLSVLLGVCYSAYLTAIRIVVEKQSTDFANHWLELVRDGDLDTAFLETQPPEKRPPAGDDLHKELETRFNMAENPSQKGSLSLFRQFDIVQILQQGGKDTQIQPRGVVKWPYEQGGYRVTLEYLITTPEVTCEIELVVFSSESRRSGRKWTVQSPAKAIRQETAKWTALGQTRRRLRERSSMPFLTKWTDKLDRGRILETYVDTRPSAEQRQLPLHYAGNLVLTVCAAARAPGTAVLLTEPERYLPGFTSFANADFVTVDPEQFYSGVKEVKADDPALLAKVREALAKQLFPVAAGAQPYILVEANADRPMVRKGDRLHVEHNSSIMVKPDYLFEGAFLLEADARPLDQNKDPSDWQLVGFRLTRIRSLQMPMPLPGGARAPGG